MGDFLQAWAFSKGPDFFNELSLKMAVFRFYSVLLDSVPYLLSSGLAFSLDWPGVVTRTSRSPEGQNPLGFTLKK